jgi:WhiB family redox-sensing transcriptional regulator
MEFDEWQERAACRGIGWQLFFSDAADDIRAALAICRRCDVRSQCLDAAMRTGEAFGVWGGTPETHRRRIFRAARRRRVA